MILYAENLRKKKPTVGFEPARARSLYGAHLRVTAIRSFHESQLWIFEYSYSACARTHGKCLFGGAPRAARRARAGACWLSVLKRRENGSHARADGGSMGPSTLDRENGDVQSSVRSRRISRGRHCVPRSTVRASKSMDRACS